MLWTVVCALGGTIGLAALGASAGETVVVPNGDFAIVSHTSKLPEGWHASFGKGTQATIECDTAVSHRGKPSVRLSQQSPTAPYIYGHFACERINVLPSTTYLLRFFTKGTNVGKCYAGANFDRGGNERMALPVGTYDWRPLSVRVTTPADCTNLSIHFATDGVTDALWIAEIALQVAPTQLANLSERRYPKDFPGMFPRTPGPLPEHLMVVDARHSESDSMLLVALQGIVNRKGPRLYLLHRTDPHDGDEMWLKYLQEKRYTGKEERLADAAAAIARFRDEITGVVIFDAQLSGTRNAAWMLAGLTNALPASAETAAKLNLPIVEDLRGRWNRNIDAYRYIYEHYWDRMCHHVLAWECPQRWQENSSRDYEVQWNVFCFWLSSYGDPGEGNDPSAEREFLEELLAATPGNVPVMGWMSDGRQGITEYAASRLLSEYGKWIPGTGFNCNASVLSAVHPKASDLRRKVPLAQPHTPLESNKVYISINVIDSGDAQWYWQSYQRKIWADPLRGTAPTGYCVNMTLAEMLPPVAQWYAENASPNDTLFGYLYMNAPVYATRYRQQDRARIWREYVQYHDDSCRALGLDGIELYNGAGGPTASDELLRRFTQGLSGLDYILADFSRHSNIHPSNANYLLDNTVVFHTLTQFKVWGADVSSKTRHMEQENAWLIEEIQRNSPTERPGFMVAQAASWFYFPAWFKDLKEKLPPQYVLVSPGELARLYRQYRQQQDPGTSH